VISNNLTKSNAVAFEVLEINAVGPFRIATTRSTVRGRSQATRIFRR